MDIKKTATVVIILLIIGIIYMKNDPPLSVNIIKHEFINDQNYLLEVEVKNNEDFIASIWDPYSRMGAEEFSFEINGEKIHKRINIERFPFRSGQIEIEKSNIFKFNLLDGSWDINKNDLKQAKKIKIHLKIEKEEILTDIIETIVLDFRPWYGEISSKNYIIN